MSAVSQYESMLSALNQADQGLDPSKVPPVLEDVLNEKTLAGKSALQGVSGVLVAKSATTAIKRLTGSKGSASRKALNDAGISDADIDEVADAGAGGDLSELGTSVLNVGVKALNRSLGNGFNYLKDAGKNFGSKISDTFKNNPASDALDDATDAFDFGGGSNPYSLSRVFGGEESDIFSGKSALPSGTEDPFSLPDEGDLFARATSSGRDLLGGLRGDSTLARVTAPPPAQTLPEQDIKPVDPDPKQVDPEPEPSQASSEITEATESTSKIADDISEGGKIVKGLKKAGEGADVAGGEFDPVELGIGAVLGLAGTIGSIFIKDHHTKNVASQFTNEIVPVNYSSQLI